MAIFDQSFDNNGFGSLNDEVVFKSAAAPDPLKIREEILKTIPIGTEVKVKVIIGNNPDFHMTVKKAGDTSFGKMLIEWQGFKEPIPVDYSEVDHVSCEVAAKLYTNDIEKFAQNVNEILNRKKWVP